jgi:transposase-like protein
MAKRKKRQLKRLPAATRARILAEARTKGLTAEQVEKKYGVSKWTFYGWRKRTGKARTGFGRAAGRVATVAVSQQTLRSEIRAVLPGILREELARALGSVFGGAGVRRRARR